MSWTKWIEDVRDKFRLPLRDVPMESPGCCATDKTKSYWNGYAAAINDVEQFNNQRKFAAITSSSKKTNNAELLNRAIEIIETGDQRLLASDGPIGGLPPNISLDEWRELYEALISIRDS